MDIDVVSPSALAPARLDEWRRLQAADPALDSPFLSPGWAMAVERAQTGMRGAVRVAVFSEQGTAKGFFAARVTGSIAMPVGAPMNDYQGVVGAPDLIVAPRRLIQALGVDRLDFDHWLAEQSTFAPFMRGQSASHRIDLSAGYQAYAAGRRETGTGVFKTMSKRRRKLEREVGPVQFTAGARDPEDLATLLAWKSRQYNSTGQINGLRRRWTVQLLEDLFADQDPNFGGMLFTLRVGGQLAAAQFNLRGRHTLHCWFIAFAPEFERYSAGLVLFDEILRWMDQSRWSVLDLGPGDYGFKLRLANDQRSVAHGYVGRFSTASLVRSAGYGLRAVAERLPLGLISKVPRGAMRRLDTLRALR